jgi:hypothetical protein
MATPGYIEAVGMTLLAGRVFDERDGTLKDAPVAIVNETFAKYHWPGKNPVGRLEVVFPARLDLCRN